MTRVVRFTIAAPLASWGVGGATIRPTQLVPTHSAIVGLVASALGLARTDERQAELASAYARAVQTEHIGSRLTDFHTIQTPHRPAIKRTPRTRAEELLATTPRGTPWTSITQREYIQDVRYIVVLWPIGEPLPWAPSQIVDALKHPRHCLYAGRRSCAFSDPLAPEVVQAKTLDEVLSGDRITWDAAIPSGTLMPHHEMSVNDQLLSPSRRAFGRRHDLVQ